MSGVAPQVLPGVGTGFLRDGGLIRHPDLRCARSRRAHPRLITQGAQFLDRQDLVSIRIVHNVV
ncbi:MAG: hypothetical protein ACRDRX_07085 [Pseudonocardiaceae bacterium]